MGGPVAGGSTYLVGERGPELFTPGTSGSITPNHALGGGGNTITVNVNGGDPNQVVAAIQKWVRNNGAIPMTTTTAIRR
jgi:phage-related minor tail protein